MKIYASYVGKNSNYEVEEIADSKVKMSQRLYSAPIYDYKCIVYSDSMQTLETPNDSVYKIRR